MLSSLVLVPLVSAMTKAPNAGFVAEIFSCYEETVTVPAKASIGYGKANPGSKNKKKKR